MVSIRKLERLLEPHSVDWGASSAYTMFNVYQIGDVRVRVDEWELMEKDIPYKQALVDAAKKLGLM